MNILTSIAQQWDNILVVILLIASAIAGVKKFLPQFLAMSTQEKIAYITRLLTNLIPSALTLVTDAEIQYGEGTGTIKRAYVIDELYQRIPDEYKKYITEENLDAIINKVLPEAQDLWVKNPAVKTMMTTYGAVSEE